MKRFFKYAITLLVVIILIPVITNAQTIKRSKQKTEQTQKKNNSNKSNKSPSKTSKADSQKPNNSSSKKNNKSQMDDTSTSAQPSTSSTQPAEPTAYDVTFSCNVTDADMYIDGNDYGHPQGVRTLKAGNHQVKVVADSYEDFVTTINVAKGNTSFDFTMTKLPPKGLTDGDIKTIIVNGVSFDMVYVKGGTFNMGATQEQGEEFEKDEKPVHQVTLSDYYIAKYEITKELWKAVMYEDKGLIGDAPTCPVVYVSWNECQVFITQLNEMTGMNFRLLTEAEWEFAARGGNRSKGYKYSGGNRLHSVGWSITTRTAVNDYNSSPHPVGQKSPNELGIFDMSGNVWEWCQDWYGNYSSENQTNPTGPMTGTKRVKRGGSWETLSDKKLRVSCRNSHKPNGSDQGLGFRIAASSL